LDNIHFRTRQQGHHRTISPAEWIYFGIHWAHTAVI